MKTNGILKKLVMVSILMLFFGTLSLPSIGEPLKDDLDAPPTTVYVDDDYNETTPGWGITHFSIIQEGIDAVAEQGIVYVNNGVYYEYILINKTIQLVGQDAISTIIDGSGIGDLVTVTADEVELGHFSIINGEYGITVESNANSIVDCNIDNQQYPAIILDSSAYNQLSHITINNTRWGLSLVDSSNNNTVTDCTATNNFLYSIYLDESPFNTVTDCIIRNNNRGIWIDHCSNIEIESCDTIENDYDGIILLDSHHNQINNCTVHDNLDDGIQLDSSTNNHILNCTVNDNDEDGISLFFSSDNHINDSRINRNTEEGIYVGFESMRNSITNCTISDSNRGIYLEFSQSNSIMDCAINNNDYGLRMNYSSYNTIIDCILDQNTLYGLFLYYSDNNTMYHNNFHNNILGNAYDMVNNFWDNGYPSGGNYWDDHPNPVDEFSGPGQNEPGADGIVDTPYDITGGSNQDNYPFMNLDGWINNPPEIPAKPTGRIWGTEDRTYTYTTSTTDPEGDQVFYQWDWGDGHISDWYGPFDSGAPATAQHIWTNPGHYYIRVRAKDVHGAESDWSEAQHVVMRRFGLPPIPRDPFLPN